MPETAVAPPKKHTLADTKKLKPQHYVFAKLIGEGKGQREAALIAFPTWREWKTTSVDCEASKLASNPNVAQLIELHSIGAHDLGKSYLPQAVVTTVEIMANEAVKPDTRLKAADSIKDRFGAPRNAQVAINAQTVSLNLLADIEGGQSIPLESQATAKIPTPTPSITSKRDTQSTKELPPQSPTSTPPSQGPPTPLPPSKLQGARDTWAQIASPPSKPSQGDT